ncbi:MULTISPECIES: bifunctional nicotinamidase/pyrazinamidase [unclassified Pseudomonas]|uniref:bifunctional nicotinamidase/pyrazinamidase n=1 Tax=unclassified Pseudomonas TaxID=196821 RepID=UPI0025ECB0C0|nr:MULTISPECIES: bifunctional nicotinamidase/pyrazinamidase [unclassified Pseudomonas]
MPTSLSRLAADPRSVLLVIDMQYDFLPGGALAVAGGDTLVPLINRLGAQFRNVVISQDWHPAEHISFASSHAGRQPFDSITLPCGPQTLWPDHCIQGTRGAEMHAGLNLPHVQLILRKGCNPGIDSYSAFVEADRTTQTGLAGYLKERGIDSVFVVGLALDYCVAWTALDARAAGFNTWVITDACKPIDLGGSLDKAWRDFQAADVMRINSRDLVD